MSVGFSKEQTLALSSYLCKEFYCPLIPPQAQSWTENSMLLKKDDAVQHTLISSRVKSIPLYKAYEKIL